MTNRLRVHQFIIQPVAFIDDGQTLAPFETAPIKIAAADLEAFPAMFRADEARIQAEITAAEAEKQRLADEAEYAADLEKQAE
jgi:hypothetical protein